MTYVSKLVQKHNNWRKHSINLLPSENVLSPNVLRILGSDLAGRYSLQVNDRVHNEFVENAYRGTKYFEEILSYGIKLGNEIFGSKYIEIRPLSGHIAAMIMLLSLVHRKELIYTINAEHGGYDGYMPQYLPDILNLRVRFIPFNSDKGTINYEQLELELKKHHPQLLILGASYFPFSYDLKRIYELCALINCKIAYDASHVLGLIAGKAFQPDVLKFSDILFGSTHKSLFGPQGGVLITNNENIYETIESNITWRTMDNYHLNRVAALVQAFEEIKVHGSEYATQVIKNAKTLAKNLDNSGFKIKYAPEYTESHQILYDTTYLSKTMNITVNEFSKMLERSNIIIDSVGRLGTNEITRLGMVEHDIEYVKMLFLKALKQNIKKEVMQFRAKFNLQYY